MVIGDVFLDEYLTGKAERLSREAPIPVLEFKGRRPLPGGAANPAMNIIAMGSDATLVSEIGADEQGRELLVLLQIAGVDAGQIIQNPLRSTSLKTRIVAEGSLRFPQQLARLDRIDRHPPDVTLEAALLARIETAAPHSGAFVISDYRSGLLTPSLAQGIMAIAARYARPLLVDSQGALAKYRGAHTIRCNLADTAAYLRQTLDSEAALQSACERLLAELQAQEVIIGRGEAGVSFMGVQTPYTHLPAANRSEVFDVTGAGDTSIAVLALAAAAGLELATAAALANFAAGLVVRRLGNYTPQPKELSWAIDSWFDGQQ
jgi:D-glycero-beta-D-manno-heptose-7-phosphate kinase